MKLSKRLPQDIIKKCANLCKQLDAGTPYAALKGKRLDVKHNDGRTRVSIPVGYKYRLICLFDGKKNDPLELITHEDYNKKYCL